VIGQVKSGGRGNVVSSVATSLRVFDICSREETHRGFDLPEGIARASSTDTQYVRSPEGARPNFNGSVEVSGAIDRLVSRDFGTPVQCLADAATLYGTTSAAADFQFPDPWLGELRYGLGVRSLASGIMWASRSVRLRVGITPAGRQKSVRRISRKFGIRRLDALLIWRGVAGNATGLPIVSLCGQSSLFPSCMKACALSTCPVFAEAELWRPFVFFRSAW